VRVALGSWGDGGGQDDDQTRYMKMVGVFSLPPWGKGLAWVEDERRNRAVCCCWLARDGHACGGGEEEEEVVAWVVARDPRPSLR